MEAGGNLRKILIPPVPRYLLHPCCNDPDHVSNIRDADYRKQMEDGLFECRKHLRDFSFRQGLRNIHILSPIPELRRLGDSVWENPVHMSPEGFACMAGMVDSVLSAMETKLSYSLVNRGLKRGGDSI